MTRETVRRAEGDGGEAEADAPLVLVPERPGFDRYLEDTIVVDWQTPSVIEQARALVAGRESERERVEALFAFVRDEIRHSLDAPPGESDVVTCSASHVLRERTGLCYAKSHLLAALLRSRGIPAGFGYQRLRAGQPGKAFVLHGFVVAWLEELERWVALDARGDTDTIHTRVDVDRPSLAFPTDPAAGELTFPTIFARPSRRVVECLDHAQSLARLRNHLPDSLTP